jgi:hypothetical protein
MTVLQALLRPRTIVNTLTDPSVILGIGTTLLMSGLGLPTLLINSAIVGLSALTRLGTELVHQGYGQSLPKSVQSYLQNKGAALQTRGTSFIAAAGAGVMYNDMADVAKRTLSLVLTTFGAGMYLRGVSTRFNLGSAKQKILDNTGMNCIIAGCLLTVRPEMPIAIPAAMITAGAIGTTLAFNDRAAKTIGKYQIPDLLLSGAFFATAALTNNPAFAVTNLLYGAGYIALPLTRAFGGVAQAGEAMAATARKQAKPLALAALMQYENLRN